MAKSTKIKEARDRQKNIGKMEVSRISSSLPGDKNSSKFDADIKLKVGLDMKYGKGKDVTAEQQVNRENYVSELVLIGYSERELIGMLMHSLSITNHDATKLCKKAKEALSEPWRANFDTEVDWHVALRKRIIRKNMGDGGDDKMALAAADSLARVQRVFDVMPVLEPENSTFDAADDSMGEYSELIDEIKSGDESRLDAFKNIYKATDKRGLEHASDEDKEHDDFDNEEDE